MVGSRFTKAKQEKLVRHFPLSVVKSGGGVKQSISEIKAEPEMTRCNAVVKVDPPPATLYDKSRRPLAASARTI